MKFKVFVETTDIKPFLTTAMEKFPDTTDLLVLADALDDDGDEKIANVIRQMISGTNHDMVAFKDAVNSELKKAGVAIYLNNERLHDLKTNLEYEWAGKAVIVHSLSGSATQHIVKLEDIKKPAILKGLAVLAALFFNKSHSTHYGLEDYKTTKGVISRAGKQKMTEESQLRYAIRDFLLYFNQFEELVRKLNRNTRQRWDDQRETTRLINYRGYGNLWQIPMTEHILEQFIKDNGGKTTPFLQRLSQRLFAALNLVGNVEDPDEKMIADLTRIATLIRGNNNGI